MARPRKNSNSEQLKPQPEDRAKFDDYINVNLRANELKGWQSWHDENIPANLLDAMTELADNGYSVSMRADRRNGADTYQANIMGYYADNDNPGLVLSMRSGSQEDAISKVLYAHFVLFEKKWVD